MKFIHCADLHLDSKIDTLPSEKSKKRREEILHTFERLCEYAKNNSVTAVIIAGDMFDTQRITVKTRGRVLSAIKSTPEVDYLYLAGNHDDENFIKDADDLPANLKSFTEEWTKFCYGDVEISGTILTPTNAKYVYDRLNLSEDKANIVVMHGQVAGYKSEDKAEIISIPKLKEKNIDYLSLGHIHSYSKNKIDTRGEYAYCGCLDGRGFDETGKKGFVLLTCKDKKITSEFVHFGSRDLYEFEFDVTSYSDWYDCRADLLEKLTAEYSAESLIKVVLKGEHGTDFEIDVEDLVLRLNERFYFGKVYDRTNLKVSIEDYATDKSVRGEFVRLVLESELTAEEKDEIILLGLNVLKGDGVL